MGTKVSGSQMVAATVAVLLLGIWRAWVLTVLWRWFLVPLGLPQIKLALAYGILTVASLVLPSMSRDDDKDTDLGGLIRSLISRAIGVPLIELGVGWLAHLFLR